MTSPSTDKVFSGQKPQLYEKYLVPMIFEPFAKATDIAEEALARRFGPGEVDGMIQACVVTVDA